MPWPGRLLSASISRSWRARGSLAVGVGVYVIVASVLAALWRAAANAHQGSVAGYTAAGLTWYIFTTEAAVMALNPRQIEITGDDIATGTIAVEMLRPASVLGVRFAIELGRCLPRLAVCWTIGILLSALVTGGAPISTAGVVLAAPSLLLAVSCNLLAQHAFAGAAFWIRDSQSAWFLYQKLVFILGGMLIPLEALPTWLHAIARWLPFSAMAYAPARQAAGHPDPSLILIQLIWLAVLGALAWAVFTRGERRLQVVGG